MAGSTAVIVQCLAVSASQQMAYPAHVNIEMIVPGLCLLDKCTTIIPQELMHRHDVLSLQLYET